MSGLGISGLKSGIGNQPVIDLECGVTYEEWEETVPEVITGDPVWKFYAYRKALFLYDLAWRDCDKLVRDLRGQEVARHSIRSAGSICANIEEGCGRGFGKDRNYYLRVATGSARETRGWYYRARHLLSPAQLKHRMDLLSEVIALLVTEHNLQRQSQSQPLTPPRPPCSL